MTTEREIAMRERLIRLLINDMDWWRVSKLDPPTADDPAPMEICTTEGFFVITVSEKPYKPKA